MAVVVAMRCVTRLSVRSLAITEPDQQISTCGSLDPVLGPAR
jgi:hypothetical protein